MAGQLPYLTACGNITKALNKIKDAAAPTRFTYDFLESKLAMTGGSARPVIPFLKRVGFLGGDGTPTELYHRFRNANQSGGAVAEALRKGYSALYEVNEFVHAVKDSELKGIVVQVTGLPNDSKMLQAVIGSFKALKSLAKFDEVPHADEVPTPEARESSEPPFSGKSSVLHKSMGLSYTINLNLPATSDIGVFNAIFKSLKEHLLK